MLRPPSPTAALVGVVATLGALAGVPAASAEPAPHAAPHAVAQVGAQAATQAADEEETPLEVTMTSMAPSVAVSDVTITGTVTNRSEETWTGIHVLPFTSATPITDATTLALSAASDPALNVGDRILVEGTYATIDSLAPGDSAPFTAVVPRSSIGTQAGVYWIGVHALGGSGDAPSDGLADGRARSFIPVLPEDAEPVDAALVIPLRATVHHEPDGSISDPAQWARRLRPGGRLANVLGAGQAAGDRPVTWLVDPAVLDAVRHLAEGNEPLSIAPLPEPVDPEQPADSTSPTPEDPSASPTPSEGPQPTGDDAEAAEAARAWLQPLIDTVVQDSVLALPYGDVDMSAAVRNDPGLYDLAQERSVEVMTSLGIPSSPALAPTSGYLSPEAISRAPRETVVLLSDTALSRAQGTPPVAGQLLGHDVVTTSSGVAAGGPGPGSPSAPVAVRQRLLSEAMLRMSDDEPNPIVVLPPPTWNPRDAGALVSGFEDGVVRMRALSELGGSGTIDDELLVYPDAELDDELPPSLFTAARAYLSAGALLSGVLVQPAGVDVQAGRVALPALSYLSRRDPDASRLALGRSTAGLRTILGRVTVDGPPAVTLSSDQGNLGATVSNALDEAVTVRVVALTDGGLELVGPETITLAPQSRRRILLDATATRQGFHTVTLQVTDVAGTRLGSSTTFSVRTAQVSQVIWLIMGVGAAMLFGAIGVRLVRRLRGAATGGPATDDPGTEAETATEPQGDPHPSDDHQEPTRA